MSEFTFFKDHQWNLRPKFIDSIPNFENMSWEGRGRDVYREISQRFLFTCWVITPKSLRDGGFFLPYLMSDAQQDAWESLRTFCCKWETERAGLDRHEKAKTSGAADWRWMLWYPHGFLKVRRKRIYILQKPDKEHMGKRLHWVIHLTGSYMEMHTRSCRWILDFWRLWRNH